MGFFCSVIRNLSFMFRSFGAAPPPSSFQLNKFSSEPSITGTVLINSGNPAQILLPAPKGMSSKSLPRTSNSDSKNLSDLNAKGSSQIVSCRPIAAYAFTKTREPFGTSYPHNSTSCSTVRGINGTAGCNLKVSFTTHHK